MSSRASFYFLYRSAYLLLYLLLLALLLVTPADVIVRSFMNGQRYNIIIVAVFYIVTILIVVFVYALRLFLNKSVLASIPKSWIPVDRPDVKPHVYEMISAGLSKSAAITLRSRPRILERGEDGAIIELPEPLRPSNTTETRRTSRTSTELRVRDVARPVWGDIDHPGWASPNSADLPNLQYSTVLSELPNLIEAKALTLASTDAAWPSSAAAPPLDLESAALLERPLNASLRQYLDHLMELGLLRTDAVVGEFVDSYERARFSNRPVSNGHFREIMRLFAEILRDLGSASRGSISEGGSDGVDDENSKGHGNPEHEVADSASSRLAPSTPRSRLGRTLTGNSEESERHSAGPSSADTWQHHLTAGSLLHSKVSRKAGSSTSFAGSKRRPHPRSQPSSTSLRSKMSAVSGSGSGSSPSSSHGSLSASGSVIRLATAQDNHDLPYVLGLRESGAG